MTNLVSYPVASIGVKVSVSTLMRAVAAGHLTRHTDPRDKRRTLLDLQEVTNYFDPNQEGQTA